MGSRFVFTNIYVFQKKKNGVHSHDRSNLWTCSHIPCSCHDQPRPRPPSCHSSNLWFCILCIHIHRSHNPCSHIPCSCHDQPQPRPLSCHSIPDRIHHSLRSRSRVRILRSHSQDQHSQDHSPGHSLHSSFRSRHQHQPQRWPQQQQWPRPPSCRSILCSRHSIPCSCSCYGVHHDRGRGRDQPERHQRGGRRRQ